MNMNMGSVGGSPTLLSNNPAPGASSSTGMGDVVEAGCSCTLFKISSTSPQSAKTTPFWLATPGWNSSWSLAETRYEEQRRLVWSALTLATAHVSYTNSLGEAPLDLAITKPWMVRLSRLSLSSTLPKSTNSRLTLQHVVQHPLPWGDAFQREQPARTTRSLTRRSIA